MKKISITIIILAIVIISGYVIYEKTDLGEKFGKNIKDKPLLTEFEAWDEAKADTHLGAVGKIPNAYWRRDWFYWNDVESTKGKYDWSVFDERIWDYQKQGIYLIMQVMPFANWDQEFCHPEDKYISYFDEKKGGTLRVGKPCDMESYAIWLATFVERYDGDGVDDAPTLLIPVRYWEIGNEPLIDEEFITNQKTKFFVGTSEDYLDILKTSYQVVKLADPNSKVLMAGPAGWIKSDQEAWQPFFEAKPGAYFDIVDIHSIDTTHEREDMYVIGYQEFLQKYGLADKPLFVTEAQFWGLGNEPPDDIRLFERTMVRATTTTLAHGAKKILYIPSWENWKTDGQTTQEVYENLIDKINIFNTVATLKEEYTENYFEDQTIRVNVGQYKFVHDNSTLYVLWGRSDLPPEINGTVLVTDIYGYKQIVKVEDIVLTNEPLFVEVID